MSGGTPESADMGGRTSRRVTVNGGTPGPERVEVSRGRDRPGPAAGGRRTAEPFLWLLFSGGGVVAALVLPVLVLVLGLLVPLGLVDPPDLHALLTPWIVRLTVLGVIFLCLAHAAHRIRFTAEEMLRLSRWDLPIAVLCYGLALAGTIAAALILF